MAREPEPARPEAEVEVEAAARRILAERLAGARWSASKGRTTMAVELADVGWLGHHGAGRHALAIVRVTFADGGPGESYLLPLVVDDGAPREACPTDGTWGAVADAVRVGLVVRGTRGLFTFEAEPGADDAGGPPGPRARAADPGAPSAAPRERPVGDQTHSSAVVDGDRVVKLLRRLGPGGAREVRVGWLLGGASPFRGSPALLGHAAHVGAGGMTTVLGLVHAFVPDARDGYEATNSAIRAWLGVPDEAGLRVSTDAAACPVSFLPSLLRASSAAPAPLPMVMPYSLRTRPDPAWTLATLAAASASVRPLAAARFCTRAMSCRAFLGEPVAAVNFINACCVSAALNPNFSPDLMEASIAAL